MNHSIEHETNKLAQRVLTQLGERLNCFYHQRFVALDNYLNGLLEDHDWCSDTITDAEIEGAYEMVTEHLFPYSSDEMDGLIAIMNAKDAGDKGGHK